jgi:uncharacterized protein (DUF58 family)
MLDAALLNRIGRLRLVARHIRAGQMQGERRSTKRGTSVEFADYRDYARGDDLRRVDWNIYARLERPFVKLFEDEEDLAVHLLLDGSSSMDWGGDGEARGHGDTETRGSDDGEVRRKGSSKWEYARRMAAALGYIALASGDRLSVAMLQCPMPNAQCSMSTLKLRGKGQTLRLFDWLSGLQAAGTTDLNASLRAYALAGGRAGLVLLISDLFSPTGCTEGLTALAARGHETVVLHLLTPDEVDPPLSGDLRLVDVETGEPQDVTVDGGVRALYRRRLEAWQDELRAICRTRNARYLPVTTDAPLDRLVLHDLRRSGVVRG